VVIALPLLVLLDNAPRAISSAKLSWGLIRKGTTHMLATAPTAKSLVHLLSSQLTPAIQ
jgi:hypothetical protein